MSDPIPVRLRRLPEGRFQQALQVGGNGRYLRFEMVSAGADFPAGSLLEIETGSWICLGELVQREGLQALVHVEHSIDRARLPAIEETWS
jgi:hypothetical protein